MSVWDTESLNLLLENLHGKEHLYNRNHPNYKIYNVIKEVAVLGNQLKPPKTGKEVLDKITSIREHLIKTKKIIEENTISDVIVSPLFNKCQFMYISLFGEISKGVKRKGKAESEIGNQLCKIQKKHKDFQSNIDLSTLDIQNPGTGHENITKLNFDIVCESIESNEDDEFVDSETFMNKIEEENINGVGDLAKSKTTINKVQLQNYDLNAEKLIDKDYDNDFIESKTKMNTTHNKCNDLEFETIIEEYDDNYDFIESETTINSVKNKYFDLDETLINEDDFDLIESEKSIHKLERSEEYKNKIKSKDDTTTKIIPNKKDDANLRNHDENLNYATPFKVQSQKKSNEVDKENYKLLSGGERLEKLINFIRDKHFLWDKEHISYHNAALKKKVLEDYGKTFNPPVPEKLFRYRINYIRKMFFNAVKEGKSDWHLFNHCKFLLKSETNSTENYKNNENTSKIKNDKVTNIKKIQVNEKVYEVENQRINYIIQSETSINKVEEEEEIPLAGGERLLAIINFIRDKPFLWDREHPSYYNAALKNKALQDFGKNLNPPYPGKLIRYRINYLKKQFAAESKREKSQWHLFNDCKFFFKSKNRFSSYCTENEQKEEEKTNIYRIIQFLRDKPFFFDIKHPKHKESQYKRNLLIKFGKSLNPSLSLPHLKFRILYLKQKFFKCLKKTSKSSSWRWFNECKFFLGTSKNIIDKEKNVKETTNSQLFINETLDQTLNILPSFPIKPEIVFVPENSSEEICAQNLETPIKEIGIQCNLYEDLLMGKIENNVLLKNSEFYDEIRKIINSFNPIDTNKKFKGIDAENNHNGKVFHDNFHPSDEILDQSISNFCEWTELADNDSDSSDYGITELPFPDEAKKNKIREKSIDSHVCHICLKECNSSFHLEKHYQNFHTQRSLLCSKCGKINKNFRKMQQHEVNCNLDENRYCYECKKIFKSKIIYEDHLNCVHDIKNPYICCCNRSFKKYSKFVYHLNKFECGSIDQCTLPDYTTKEFLETFIEIKDKGNIKYDYVNQKGKLWCRICKTNFYSNPLYMAHFDKDYHVVAEKLWIKQFNVEKPFKCEFCNHNKLIFMNTSELVKHRNKYHHKRTLTDYFEKFEYTTSDKIILLKQPTDYSSIYSSCHLCKEIFFMGNFEEHFNNDGHIYLEKKWLEKHNITEIECNNCLTKFKSLWQFLKHKKSSHNEWPTNRLIKSIICETCDNIPEYLMERFNSKFIYKCSVCSYYCSGKYSYIKHLLIHISKKYIKCSCGEQFITPTSLYMHRKKKKCSKEGCIIPEFILDNDTAININSVSTELKNG